MASQPEAEKRIVENRHELGFEPWAQLWGMDYRLWRAGEPFPELGGDALVLEIRPDEAATEAWWAARGK